VSVLMVQVRAMWMPMHQALVPVKVARGSPGEGLGPMRSAECQASSYLLAGLNDALAKADVMMLNRLSCPAAAGTFGRLRQASSPET
jgi:hypothetical protein